MTDHHLPVDPADAATPMRIGSAPQLLAIAQLLRRDTWEIVSRWSAATGTPAAHEDAPPDALLEHFGEIPAFLAALAHALERIAGGSPLLEAGQLPADQSLRDAAAAHARRRAAAGYTQRDMLAEFIALRRVLWEHLASASLTDRPTLEAERIVNLLLDNVIVEAADQCFAELTDALARRAERDPLTGLLNGQSFRTGLEHELERARRYHRELTVVLLDLDCFKQVNDTLGHLAGDSVLKRLASLLQTHTREQDLVARLGGDEFAIALIEADEVAAADLVRRLRIHLTPARRQFHLPDGFGISYGAASLDEAGATAEQLLFAADKAMYRAKGPGRGQRMEQAGALPELCSLRVLVADDDAVLRQLCRDALEREGFAVAEARDGIDAVEQVLADPPDLLLLDVDMPRLDGWRVARRIAGLEHARDMPVVMLTGASDEASLSRAERAGVADYVSKPFDPAELVATVNRVLEQAAPARRMREDLGYVRHA